MNFRRLEVVRSGDGLDVSEIPYKNIWTDTFDQTDNFNFKIKFKFT